MAGLNDIPESGLVSNEDFALTCVNAGSGLSSIKKGRGPGGPPLSDFNA